GWGVLAGWVAWRSGWPPPDVHVGSGGSSPPWAYPDDGLVLPAHCPSGATGPRVRGTTRRPVTVGPDGGPGPRGEATGDERRPVEDGAWCADRGSPVVACGIRRALQPGG